MIAHEDKKPFLTNSPFKFNSCDVSFDKKAHQNEPVVWIHEGNKSECKVIAEPSFDCACTCCGAHSRVVTHRRIEQASRAWLTNSVEPIMIDKGRRAPMIAFFQYG